MNITKQMRSTFERVLSLLANNALVCADFETTGLRMHHGDKMFSLSLYFPSTDESFNLSFRAGIPARPINITETLVEFHTASTWTNKQKKHAYIRYWFEKFRVTRDFENLPMEWFEELKAVWGKGRYIFHNAKFDMTVGKKSGLPDIDVVEDTMLALHLVCEDFRRIPLVAPYMWTTNDATNKMSKDKKTVIRPALCKKEQVGTWVRGQDGELLKKEQMGNRRLKWFAAFLNVPDATRGEEELHKAILEFEEEFTDFICQFPDDPINDFAKLKKKGGLSRSKIRAKIHFDDKSDMWMLPSSKTAFYAELDTKLTWFVREWALGVIRDWDNEAQYYEACRIQQLAAFPMEYHGAIIDIEAAQNEIARLEPRIKEVETILKRVASDYGFRHFDPSEDIDTVDLDEDEEEEYFNVSSPKQLIRFLNSDVLSVDFGHSLFPAWFPAEFKADLKTYEGVYVEKTNKETLDMIEGHPIIRLIRLYRMMHKACNTYLKRWISAADSNNAVHSSFNVDGTVSWRMSSNGDGGNWQNIPHTGYYRIAEAVIAPRGYKIGALDYRTLEMGIAAAIAEGGLGLPPQIGSFDFNMPLLTELRKMNADVHTRTVYLIGIREVVFGDMTDDEILIRKGYDLSHEDFNTPEKRAKKVKKEIRQIAKTLNFGLLYAGTAKMVSLLLKINRETAEILVQRWRKAYPAYARAQEYFTKLALTRRPTPTGRGTGMYVTQPISNRHRKIHKYPTWMTFVKYGRKQGLNPQEAASRKTWNNIVQGLGGYFCTVALLRYYEKYGYEHLIAFAQIHDALEVYVKEGSEQHLLYLAECMVDFDIDPGLRVDVSVSKDNWQNVYSLGAKDDYTYGRGEAWDNEAFNKAFENWCLTPARN